MNPVPAPNCQGGSHNGEPPHPCLPKLCGADFEMGNLILGIELPKGTGALASHLL
jgi:hypothetical protein